MHAQHVGYRPGLAAPEAASSGGATGAASMVTHVVATARLTPQNEPAPAVQARQSRKQIKDSNSAADTSTENVFLSLRERLALRGHSLHRTQQKGESVRYYVTRWGLVRELSKLAEVEQFLDQVGDAHV